MFKHIFFGNLYRNRQGHAPQSFESLLTASAQATGNGIDHCSGAHWLPEKDVDGNFTGRYAKLEFVDGVLQSTIVEKLPNCS